MLKKTILCIFCFLFIGMLCACGCEHEWKDATCVSPKECINCGKTDGEPSTLHIWQLANCATPKTCTVCGIIDGEKNNNHKWNQTTCVLPQTCSVCGETKGQPFGHYWIEASCITPKTCGNCGEVEGSVIDHIYLDATCENPQTCEMCGNTKGSTLEHTWQAATCEAPKTCSTCGKKEGGAVAHTYGEWEIETEATVLKAGKMIRYCDTCVKTENKSYHLSSFVKDNKFIFSPEEFRELFFDNFVELGSSEFAGAQIQTKDGQVMVTIIKYLYKKVGNIGFVVDGDSFSMASSETERGFDGIVMIISADVEFVVDAMLSVIMTCNPSISEYVARMLGKDMLTEATTYEGVTYTFSIVDDYYMLTAVID